MTHNKNPPLHHHYGNPHLHYHQHPTHPFTTSTATPTSTIINTHHHHHHHINHKSNHTHAHTYQSHRRHSHPVLKHSRSVEIKPIFASLFCQLRGPTDLNQPTTHVRPSKPNHAHPSRSQPTTPMLDPCWKKPSTMREREWVRRERKREKGRERIREEGSEIKGRVGDKERQSVRSREKKLI